jgi:hypothetical protein
MYNKKAKKEDFAPRYYIAFRLKLLVGGDFSTQACQLENRRGIQNSMMN